MVWCDVVAVVSGNRNTSAFEPGGASDEMGRSADRWGMRGKRSGDDVVDGRWRRWEVVVCWWSDNEMSIRAFQSLI